MSDEIVREIERRIAETGLVGSSNTDIEFGAKYALKELLTFIKSRPIQPVSELVARARQYSPFMRQYDKYERALITDLADALSASEARAERLAKCLSDVTLMDDIGSAIKLAQAALDANPAPSV